MSDIQKKLQKLIDARKELDAQIQQIQVQDVVDFLTPIFNNFPYLGAIAWTQYTPHFNDGDSCVFGVHYEYCDLISTKALKKVSSNEELFGFYRDTCYETPSDAEDIPEGMKDDIDLLTVVQDQKEIRKQLNEAFSKIDEDVFLNIFGDHVEVLITRDGEQLTQDYEHD